MKICVIYGTEKRGCSYNITQIVLSKLPISKKTEFFLPESLPRFCTSCETCFSDEWDKCPNSEFTVPIREALVEADVIVLTSPVYALHLSGQMKTFLDHFANMFVVHRPEESMFRKQGLVIATAVGPVTKKTLTEMKDSLDFWGVASTYQLSAALQETNWSKVKESIKLGIDKKATVIAGKLIRNIKRPPVSFRVRKWFYISRFMQKNFGVNLTDVNYWNANGWLSGKVPWKKLP